MSAHFDTADLITELSHDEMDELSTDCAPDNLPDFDDTPSRDLLVPFGTDTRLGARIVAIAEWYLKLPLREDAGTNDDSHRYVRKFFVEGLKWNPKLWDQWAEKRPEDGVPKPEWCAAFAAFCVREGYREHDPALMLPDVLSASTSKMAKLSQSAGRFLLREELFDDKGQVRMDVTPPGPGDIVIFKGHTGLLKEIYQNGTFVTVEGNTWAGKVREDGVYQCTRRSVDMRKDGGFKLQGFCLLASVDGK